MRRFLLTLVIVEAVALVAAGGALLFGIEDSKADLPAVPAFRPPIYDTVIGDAVTYRRLTADGKVLGFLEYRVEWAEEYAGTNFGRTYRIVVTERGKRGQVTRSRPMLVRPRDITHGFLPPRFDEEDRDEAPGSHPVIASIRTAQVLLKSQEVPGFLVETVIPRRSLEQVAERFWITPRVPVFGVARWERGNEVFELSGMESAGS